MIVIVAGMYRSGSTFSFNIIRELLVARGRTISMLSNSLDKLSLDSTQADHVVVKSHSPGSSCTDLVASGAAICVCTFRRPEDAIASWSRAFGFSLESSLESVRQWLIWHRTIADRALNIRYETVDLAPLSAILGIQARLFYSRDLQEADGLRKKYDKRKLKDQYDKLEESDQTTNIGPSYYDKTTLFHRRHIASLHSRAATQCFDSPVVAHIRHVLREFVDAEGRYTP